MCPKSDVQHVEKMNLLVPSCSFWSGRHGTTAGSTNDTGLMAYDTGLQIWRWIFSLKFPLVTRLCETYWFSLILIFVTPGTLNISGLWYGMWGGGKSWAIIFRFQTKAGDIFRKVTLGWTLLLPFYHTTSEVMTQSHESDESWIYTTFGSAGSWMCKN